MCLEEICILYKQYNYISCHMPCSGICHLNTCEKLYVMEYSNMPVFIYVCTWRRGKWLYILCHAWEVYNWSILFSVWKYVYSNIFIFLIICLYIIYVSICSASFLICNICWRGKEGERGEWKYSMPICKLSPATLANSNEERSVKYVACLLYVYIYVCMPMSL